MTHINLTIPDPGRGPSNPRIPVAAGQSVGTIAGAGLLRNNGTAHLHFQFWEGPNCYPQTTPANPGIPFDSAHGLRMCGLPDLYDGGPVGTANQGQWSGTPFTAQTCDTPYPGVGNATFKGVTQLTTGMRLNPNEYLTSLNGQSVLLMQGDGNLVVYRGLSIAQWNSGTSGHPGAYLVVQGDGNVVVYAPNEQPLWWTGTNSVTRFTMQTDGNLVGYDTNSQWKWQSGTGGQPAWTYKGTDHLNQYQRLNPGEYLKSADKRYFLLMQTDGNLVLYSPGYHVLWSSGTNGNAGAYLEVQGDGNIVVYRADRWPLWYTGTNNAFDLFVQNDGNLVAYTLTNSWVWQSWTGGRI
ncbi:MAG TPA: hypothetical protein VFB59_02260 [Candidatus Saccharimonadales bacterium]|nr:hypothetical protein [Candidatus Saccharimonadales bacterium]